MKSSGSLTTSLKDGPSDGKTASVDAMDDLIRRAKAMRLELNLWRWEQEYPIGHADREARKPSAVQR